MTPLIDQNKAMAETMAAYLDVRRSYTTEQYKNVVAWIEGLIVQNQIYMTECAPAKLPDTQIRLKQLMAMRSALVDPGGATTGYIFN